MAQPLPIRRPKVFNESVSVTPDMAREFLGHNVKNRPLKPRKIADYARDMAAGRWFMTGESIKFDIHGNMLDGQNRCHAVIRADVTVEMMVTRNLQPEAQLHMDAGGKRTNGDQLQLAGFTYSGTIATIAAAWTGWQNGLWKNAGAQAAAPSLTHSESLQFARDHPEVEGAAKLAKQVTKVLRLPAGVVGATFMITSEIDPQAAATFFDQIANLETTGYGDPIATLLKTVQQSSSNTRGFRQGEAFYLLIRTWNAWHKGERLMALRTGFRGKNPKDGNPFEMPVPR